MMKKILSLNIMVLSLFCTINICCAEDFFVENNNEKVLQAADKRARQEEGIQPNYAEQTSKKNIFEKIKESTKAKKAKKAKETDSYDKMPKGYYGILPNIYSDFKYKKKTPSTPKEIDYKVPTAEELDEEELKSAPFDDALFLDNIIKKEKTSDYVNNIQRLKYALNSLKNSLDGEIDIQKINASVNMVDLYTKNIETKYENKSESLKDSYREALMTNYYAKLFGNLLYESQYYSRIMPTNTGKYSESNINLKKIELLNKVNKTIFLLNQES